MRARAGRHGPAGVVIAFEGAATTQTGQFRAEALKAFRRDLRDWGPSYDSFDVRLWIDGYRRGKRFDIDNVAKAALDALCGLVWRDDRQVVRLEALKLADGPSRIVLLATPAELADKCEALEAALAASGLTRPPPLMR